MNWQLKEQLAGKTRIVMSATAEKKGALSRDQAAAIYEDLQKTLLHTLEGQIQRLKQPSLQVQKARN